MNRLDCAKVTGAEEEIRLETVHTLLEHGNHDTCELDLCWHPLVDIIAKRAIQRNFSSRWTRYFEWYCRNIGIVRVATTKCADGRQSTQLIETI